MTEFPALQGFGASRPVMLPERETLSQEAREGKRKKQAGVCCRPLDDVVTFGHLCRALLRSRTESNVRSLTFRGTPLALTVNRRRQT